MSLFKLCLFAVILAVGVGTVLSEQGANRDLSSLNNLRHKLARCVSLVTRSGLQRGEKEVLRRCAMAAVVVPPPIPHVIAVRFAKCVVGHALTGPLQRAGSVVTQCVTDSLPNFPWNQPAARRLSEVGGVGENVPEDAKSSEWE